MLEPSNDVRKQLTMIFSFSCIDLSDCFVSSTLVAEKIEISFHLVASAALLLLFVTNCTAMNTTSFCSWFPTPLSHFGLNRCSSEVKWCIFLI